MAKRLKVSILEFALDIAPSEFGYTVFDRKRERWLVYINDTKCEQTIRFTLAHELGHIVMKHNTDNSIENKEANCFARNILCPIPLRDELGLMTVNDYCNVFSISEPMAKATIANYSSDKYYITRENYDSISSKAYYYFCGYTMENLYGDSFFYGYGY